MDTWPSPQVPSLPRTRLPLRLFDTASGHLTVTSAGPAARMYVCGITPYDATHLGHASTYLAFDLLVRGWLDSGIDVRYVQNVTDVDDPLLERARLDGTDWRELAERETSLYREDMTALRILAPTRLVGAVEAIPVIAAAIRELRGKGAAYDVDGDIYFPVQSDRHFGSVGNFDESTMQRVFAEMGGDPHRAGKKHPLDPLLWRAQRPREPSWDTELGRGRPGWHIECTAIALDHLGNGIDVQGGGRDLVFPHHEMGASHAQVLTGEWPFAQHYVHAGLVGFDGEKMSKSKGNLVFVSALRREGRDPMAIRLALLAHHYRGDWAWTTVELPSAEARLERWRDAVALPAGPPAEATLDAVRRALADDLDAPTALMSVDQWVAEALGGGGDDRDAPGLVARTVDALLGVHV